MKPRHCKQFFPRKLNSGKMSGNETIFQQPIKFVLVLDLTKGSHSWPLVKVTRSLWTRLDLDFSRSAVTLTVVRQSLTIHWFKTNATQKVTIRDPAFRHPCLVISSEMWSKAVTWLFLYTVLTLHSCLVACLVAFMSGCPSGQCVNCNLSHRCFSFLSK